MRFHDSVFYISEATLPVSQTNSKPEQAEEPTSLCAITQKTAPCNSHTTAISNIA